jgi:periplasmic glucans biosynthesis protein
MFLFDAVNRSDFDDYRPQVHDSNGLSVTRESGEVLWRPLLNTPSLGNSYLWENNPKAFGLYQRGRRFEDYQDAGAHYERRPSVRVEPVGEWGQGHVRLVEIPARLEADDNIVAFWIPAEPARKGEEREFRYRLIWGDLDPRNEDAVAHVIDTRTGQGGVSGVENAETLRKFVVDFAGDVLDGHTIGATVDVYTSISSGTIVSSTLSELPATGNWRLVLDVEIEGSDPVELKAYLIEGGRALTESWLFQWRPAS